MKLITNDRLTALKLIAVVAMVVDHYNKFANPAYSQVMFSIGRIALPIFIFVLAFNLSRIPTVSMPKIAIRLSLFGLLAIPPYNAMGGTILAGWWPLNVLFLLSGLVAVVYLIAVPVKHPQLSAMYRLAAVLVFVLTGALAEFFWVGLGLGVIVWRLFVLFSRSENKQGRGSAEFYALIAAAIACLVLLNLINGNYWALLALPVILATLYIPIPKLPRWKWLFYAFYPAHLWALLLLK